ncbi:Hypothetical predicted protein [Octopus vulgaris]|uniref:Uncharacterized protein n=1 Tax=Octopus vulgaris TaxID=6645 RepID=A0AA36FID3_OCTVU|nr:Hypothetical predicted protein [Octopus vulgaris]
MFRFSGGVIVNNNDIAPSYAGIVFGIANSFATTSGGISSLTTKALTPNVTMADDERQSGGVIVNNNDIAPSYSGIIFGIANTFATTSGSISPLSAKAFTPNGTQEEWQIVFALNATVCVVSTILYAILARGEIQDWAISEDSGSPVHLDDMNTNKSV